LTPGHDKVNAATPYAEYIWRGNDAATDEIQVTSRHSVCKPTLIHHIVVIIVAAVVTVVAAVIIIVAAILRGMKQPIATSQLEQYGLYLFTCEIG